MNKLQTNLINVTLFILGNWSSPAPTCIPIQCPPLFLEDPHLSLIELNTSAWGRAVFSCSWGYRLSAPPNLECLASGHWSGPIPRCRGEFYPNCATIEWQMFDSLTWITRNIDKLEAQLGFHIDKPFWESHKTLANVNKSFSLEINCSDSMFPTVDPA